MNLIWQAMARHDKFIGTVQYRKIRSVGPNAWVLTIPREYAEDVREETNGSVELYFLNGSILLTPSSQNKYKIVGETELESDRAGELTAKIYASYLSAIDTLKIKNYNKKWKQELDNLYEKLPGIDVNFESESNLAVHFNLPYVPPEREVERAFRLCEDYSKLNKSDMKNFPKIEEIPKLDGEILESQDQSPNHYIEQQVDKITFGGKRRIIMMTSRPNFYAGIKREDIRTCFEYYNMLMNLEKLCDLEDGISRHIRSLKRPNIPADIFTAGDYSLYDYYCKASELVKNAYDSHKDPSPKNAYDIIAMKKNNSKSGVRYRGDVISKIDRKKIIERICTFKHEDYQVIWRLNLLEQSIWSITKIATNIAELGQNLKRPKDKFVHIL
jgi:hypothetical protein